MSVSHVVASHPRRRWEAIVGEFSFPDGADFAIVEDRLRRLASRWGLRTCDGDDCAQEALLALLARHRDWSPDDPRTWLWLRRVLRHKVMDVYRRAHRQRGVPLDESAPTSATAARAPDSQDADPGPAEMRKLSELDAALSELGEENRDILVMHAGRGLTFAEIADMLGLTAERVEWRYWRALRHVRSHLGALLFHPLMDDMVGGGSGTWRFRKETQATGGGQGMR
ncbi:MAG: sigma-70 family RNA polymerase sigma factor [Isosphaeraceae bacterium]